MYTFKNTERNNKKANEFETKSLLFLMGLQSPPKEITLFAIDCFNDVTGLDDALSLLWDVQAKNRQNLYPKLIGESLFTLLDNHNSDFEFYKYILFTPKFKVEYLKNDSLEEFYFENFEKHTANKIIKGLEIEYARVYPSSILEKQQVKSFLTKLVFVQDYKPAYQYVKEITGFKGNTKSDGFYEKIFNEIRDRQSAKKNSEIEGAKIKKIEDVIGLERHIRSRDIHTMIISRIIGYDFLSLRSIPFSFVKIVSNMEVEDQRDTVQECQEELSKCYFNKNTKSNFWRMLEILITSFSENSDINIEDVIAMQEVEKEISVIGIADNSILFLAALVKDGLLNEN